MNLEIGTNKREAKDQTGIFKHIYSRKTNFAMAGNEKRVHDTQQHTHHYIQN